MVRTIRGMDINYKSAGSGSPVLLLHGWGGSAESFAPVFSELSKRFYVIAPDFPGHGGSPEPQNAMGVGDFAEITREFIEKEGLRGCDVIAHSFGGRVAIYLASGDKGIFKRMVLCDAAGVRPKRTLKYYVKVYSYKLMKKAALHPFFSKTLKLFGIDVKSRVQNAGSADYRALSEKMRGTFSKVVNEDLTGRLQDIAVPTLLIWGTKDEETPIWMAERMEKLIPDCGLVRFEGAGHFAYLERFGDFMKIVDNFLRG